MRPYARRGETIVASRNSALGVDWSVKAPYSEKAPWRRDITAGGCLPRHASKPRALPPFGFWVEVLLSRRRHAASSPHLSPQVATTAQRHTTSSVHPSSATEHAAGLLVTDCARRVWDLSALAGSASLRLGARTLGHLARCAPYLLRNFARVHRSLQHDDFLADYPATECLSCSRTSS